MRIIIFVSCKLQDGRDDSVDRVLWEETVAFRPGFAKGGKAEIGRGAHT